jgi:hypothetical protein
MQVTQNWSLEHGLNAVRRQLRWVTAGWIASSVAGVVWIVGLPTGSAQGLKGGTAGGEILRARGLILVDEKGTERIVMGAPVPDPPQGKRVFPANGITFQDAKGKERGGLGILDDGRIVYALDSENCDRVGLFVFPDGRAGLLVNDDHMNGRLLLQTEQDGTASLRFLDAAAKERMVLGMDKGGAASIQIKDADGKTAFRAP